MDAKLLNIYEIRTRFSFYARQVMRGKSFIVGNRSKPFAEFRPLSSAENKPNMELKFGVLKGKVTIPADFDDPLADFENDYYGS